MLSAESSSECICDWRQDVSAPTFPNSSISSLREFLINLSCNWYGSVPRLSSSGLEVFRLDRFGVNVFELNRFGLITCERRGFVLIRHSAVEHRRVYMG